MLKIIVSRHRDTPTGMHHKATYTYKQRSRYTIYNIDGAKGHNSL